IEALGGGNSKARINDIEGNDWEAPVHVIGLDRVRIALKLENELIEFVPIRDDPVDFGNVVILGGAPVSGRIDPARERDSAVLDALRPVRVLALATFPYLFLSSTQLPNPH